MACVYSQERGPQLKTEIFKSQKKNVYSCILLNFCFQGITMIFLSKYAVLFLSH